jgi:hypothetical protein
MRDHTKLGDSVSSNGDRLKLNGDRLKLNGDKLKLNGDKLRRKRWKLPQNHRPEIQKEWHWRKSTWWETIGFVL